LAESANVVHLQIRRLANKKFLRDGGFGAIS